MSNFDSPKMPFPAHAKRGPALKAVKAPRGFKATGFAQTKPMAAPTMPATPSTPGDPVDAAAAAAYKKFHG